MVPLQFRPATTRALAVVQAASTNLPLVVDILSPLVVDILSPLVVAGITTSVASPPYARVSVPLGGAILEGISPPLFSLQLETRVGSMSPT